MYGNECGVGEVVCVFGFDCVDVWVMSKFNNGFYELDVVWWVFDDMLAVLGLDYVDLFFIYWLLLICYGGDFVLIWKVFEEL